MFKIVEVPEDAANLTEQIGTKFKYWYIGDGGSKFLYKEGRPGTGENWSEKIASELCNLLNLPHAEYELATWRGRKGVICRNFVPSGGRLVHGNELLAEICPSYPTSRFYGVKQHTIRRLFTIMKSDSIKLPIGWQPNANIEIAMDIFLGYLMLDTWISNQDRHHQNWGIIYIASEGVSYLAPTYDHASSLGRNENDIYRNEVLTSNDNRRNLENYVSRALSTFYDQKQQKRLSTLEAFINAGMKRPKAMITWLNKLNAISDSQMRSVIDNIPKSEISDTAAEFALKLLIENKQRLISWKGMP